MPLNYKRIGSLILEECNKLEERCPGYRDELLQTLTDILEYERQHKQAATNVQKRINDKCMAAGGFLFKNQRAD